ncbi:MAG: ABC transporter substrate-binding protein [Spirochaetota bacterium]|uniref:ABC transporter substrate-binding protein n=1 Tax=Rectinema subterraneum TaxID=2653714 RepID=UPI00131A8CF7|nr:ABC transporter substrate-binding protein [Rectinema subterraneum]
MFGLSGNPDTLDPQKTAGTLTFQVVKSFYDTLVEPNTDGTIVPALAESWTVSPDGLIWTFKLRRNVVFHNGQPFTSKDVRASLERIKDEATASPKRSEFAAIKEIRTPDAATVVIVLSQPYAPLLASLASGWGAILPSGLIASGHNFGAEPVGTGPFKFEKWIRDNKITMVRNDTYWMKGLPKLAKVEFQIIPERAVQVQGLSAGVIDAVEFIDPEDLPLFSSNPKVSIKKELTSLIMVMAMNCSREPLNDLRVRQAVNYAIDKQVVLDVAYGGGKVGSTFLDTGNAYYTDFSYLYPYNPDKARQLLKAAGVDTREFTITVPQNYPLHVKAAELIQQMLEKVGMHVKLQLVDWSTWLSSVYNGGNYDFTVIGHTGKLDPDGTLAGYGTGKYVKWINATAAQKIKEAAAISDFAARKKLYTEVLEIMAKEVPFVYLGTSYRYVGTRSNVVDFRMTPNLDTFDFRWTELK